jgi:hypothetical protein
MPISAKGKLTAPPAQQNFSATANDSIMEARPYGTRFRLIKADASSDYYATPSSKLFRSGVTEAYMSRTLPM